MGNAADEGSFAIVCYCVVHKSWMDAWIDRQKLSGILAVTYCK